MKPGRTPSGRWPAPRWLDAKVAASLSIAAGGLVVALTVVGYRGCNPSDATWATPLAYPNRGAATHISREDLSPASECAACHPTQYAEWRGSAMGRSSSLAAFLIDLYAASLDLRGAPAEDVEYCLQCHAPAALFGASPDLASRDAISREGVTCDVCHTAIDSIPDASPGALRWDPRGPKRGPRFGSRDLAPPGEIPAISPHHETARSELHGSSQLCGACHMSTWPTNGLPIDWTYPEWQDSPAAKQGVQCQGCHMPTYEGEAAIGAPTRRDLHRHTFAGGGDAALVRSAARLEVEVRPHFASHEVQVVVENHGSGHAFPTGNATAPAVTLELEARDADGRVVFTDRREYKLVYEDVDGEVTQDPTVAYRIVADTTLQPGERRRERFFVARRLGAVAAELRLVHRRWGEQLADHQRLAGEFLQRYLAQGVRLHTIPSHLDALDPARMAGVRAYEPIVVDTATVRLD